MIHRISNAFYKRDTATCSPLSFHFVLFSRPRPAPAAAPDSAEAVVGAGVVVGEVLEVETPGMRSGVYGCVYVSVVRLLRQPVIWVSFFRE